MKRAISSLLILFANFPGAPASASDAPRISIRFQVKSANGEFVLDLRSDEAQITENGRAQSIETFEGGQLYPRRLPITIVAVFDNSGTFRRQRPVEKQTIVRFLDQNPFALLSIFACGERITRIARPTRDVGALFTAFKSLRETAPAQFFNYSEMTKAIEESVSPETPVVMVVFSSGIGSEEVARDIVRRAKDTGIAIYPALLPYLERSVPPKERATSPEFFHQEAGSGRFLKLADSTGGQVLRADPTGNDFVATVLDALSKQLRYDYVLTFRPNITGSQKQRDVRVTLRSKARGKVLGGSLTLVY